MPYDEEEQPQQEKQSTLGRLVYGLSAELEKINDKIANYDDIGWISEQKQKLVDKRGIVEVQLQDAIAECNNFGIPFKLRRREGDEVPF